MFSFMFSLPSQHANLGAIGPLLISFAVAVLAVPVHPAAAQALSVARTGGDLLDADLLTSVDGVSELDEPASEATVLLVTADLNEILRLPGISRVQAEAIAAWVEHRPLPLPLNALLELPGIDTSSIARWRRHAMAMDAMGTGLSTPSTRQHDRPARGTVRLLARQRSNRPARLTSRLTWAAPRWSIATTWRTAQNAPPPHPSLRAAVLDPSRFAATLELKHLGPLQQIILGDYRIETGLGLVHGYPTLRGGTQAFLTHPSRFDRGLRTRTGTSHLDPDASPRGLAATVSLGPRLSVGSHVAVSLEPHAARKGDDAHPAPRAPGLGAWGAFARWTHSHVTFGVTVRASPAADGAPSSRSQTTDGTTSPHPRLWGSIYGRAGRGPWEALGEVAMSRGRIGAALGVGRLRLSPALQIQATARVASVAPASDAGRSFTRSGQLVAGESGGAMALRVQPLATLHLLLAHDRYALRPTSGHPWGRHGQRQLLQATFEPRSWLRVRLDADSRTQQTSQRGGAVGHGAVRVDTPIRSRRLRVVVTYEHSERVRLQTRWHLRQHTSASATTNGSVLAQDLRIDIASWLRVQGRLAVVEAPHYDARLYLYEADVPGLLSVPVYAGSGFRHYVVLHARPLPGFSLDAKWATSVTAAPTAYANGPARPTRALHVHATYRF